MGEHKPYRKKERDQTEANETPIASSVKDGNKTITISTLEELEELDRVHTAALNHKQRMEYLRKLNKNLYGADLSAQEKKLREGKLTIKKDP